MEANLVENYIRAKFQVEIQKYDLAGKLGILQGKFTKNSIARHEQASDTNPFRVLIYTMSPTYEQNMSKIWAQMEGISWMGSLVKKDAELSYQPNS